MGMNKKSMTLKSKDVIYKFYNSIKESLINSLFIKEALEIESFCGEPKACNPMNGQNLLKMISNWNFCSLKSRLKIKSRTFFE